MLTRYAGQQHFQDVDNMDTSISGSIKQSNPQPDAAFVANQLIVRAVAKFNAEDECGDRFGALADLNQADQLQPNDMPTLQLRAMVRLRLGDISGFLNDLHGRADTLPLFLMRGQVSGSIGINEQALEDLVAADQMRPGMADRICDELEDVLTLNGAPQSRMAKLTALRHSIHTRIKVSFCRPTSTSRSFPLVFATCCHVMYRLWLGTCTPQLPQRTIPWSNHHGQLLIRSPHQTIQQVC